MSVFDRNIEAIREKTRWTAPAILGAGDTEAVRVQAAGSGAPMFSFRGVRFHSAFDPEGEAGMQVADILSGKADLVVVFGLGCGHTLNKLVEGGKKKIVVYEPSLEILKGVLQSVDLSDLLSLDGVCLVATVEELQSKIRSIDGMEDIVTLQTTPYKRAFPAELKDFLNRVNNAHTTNRVSVITEIESCLKWNENYLNNVKAFRAYPKIDAFKDAFKGVPLVIAGAGPSLKKNAHLLRELKGKAIIIAAVTAYKPLLGYGVIPDFVIAAEKVDLPEYFTYDERDLKTRFILGEVSHPEMFTRKVRNKVIFFSEFNSLSREQARLWGSGFFPASGGSVTTSAFAIGLMAGCDPIMFVGQDLSFGTDGRTHAAGGVYVTQDVMIDESSGTVSIDERFISPALKEESLKNRFELLWLKGLDGRPVASKFDWVTFHQWFEREMVYLREAGIETRVINATEGGAWIEGMEHITLKDAIERHAKGNWPIDEMIETAEAGSPEPDLSALSESFGRMRDALADIRKLGVRVVKDTRRLKRRFKADGLLPGLAMDVIRIRKTEKRLFDRAAHAEFLWEVLTAITYRLKFMNRVKEHEGKETDFLAELECMEASYEKIVEACDRFLPKVKEALSSVEDIYDQRADHAGKEVLNAGSIS